jgi:phosphatidate cytidylyltransferase
MTSATAALARLTQIPLKHPKRQLESPFLMLSTRVKAAAVFIPLVLILIYFGGWAFNAFIILILLLAAREFSDVFGKLGYRPSVLLLATGVLAFLLQRWFMGEEHLGWLLSAIIFLTGLIALIQYESGIKEAAAGFTANLAGMLYLGWLGGFLISLRAMPNGLGWTLTALPATWLADSGAYFFGRWFGRRKLAPKLSPGKTWAGFVGGLLWGTLSGILLALLWRRVGWLPAEIPLWQGAIMGFALSALTPIGDLLISLFKRSASLKDTGELIPGHGGILDRIDTWLWAAMLGELLVRLFNN